MQTCSLAAGFCGKSVKNLNNIVSHCSFCQFTLKSVNFSDFTQSGGQESALQSLYRTWNPYADGCRSDFGVCLQERAQSIKILYPVHLSCASLNFRSHGDGVSNDVDAANYRGSIKQVHA